MTTQTDPFTVDCGEQIKSRDETNLIVVHRKNIVDGRAEEILATEDGRHADLTKWHEGPEGEWVYYERIQSDGFGSHGYVDGATRQIVQAG
jgi:hypothetical protein